MQFYDSYQQIISADRRLNYIHIKYIKDKSSDRDDIHVDLNIMESSK